MARHTGILKKLKNLIAEYRFQHRFPFEMVVNAGVSNNLQISYSNQNPDIKLLTNNPAIYTQVRRNWKSDLLLSENWNINGTSSEFSNPIVRAGLNY